MRFDHLKNGLLTVTENVFHDEAAGDHDQYIVWAAEGEVGAAHADNKKTNQAIGGTVDYFTTSEYDPNVEKIQTVLNNLGLCWRLNSIQYEKVTKYTHYEWTWEDDGPWHG